MAVESDGCVKVPSFWSSEGWYQFPAPPRPMWEYSCDDDDVEGWGVGGAAVVVVEVEVGVRLASKSCGGCLLAYMYSRGPPCMDCDNGQSLTSAARLLDSFAALMFPAPPRPYMFAL